MLYFVIYSILAIVLSIFFKKSFFLPNHTGDDHQLFSNQNNIPLVGGIYLIIPIIFMNYQNLYYSILIVFIFLLGLFSDLKILSSAKKRFIFQIIIVLLSVFFLDLEILSSKLIFFDNFLKNHVFNIFFTSFCLLILINGSNFIDGLNGLLLFNMALIITILLKLNLVNEFFINKDLLFYFIFFIIILLILNLFNLLMLGDAGAYTLSFFVGFLIIKCHNFNPNISPYFFITLLWYPCFENLFSIIRKIKSKFSPLTPDNNHLHHLIYTNLKHKINKNKLVTNNISSFFISFANLFIILVGSVNPYNSVYQLKIIIFSILIYSLLYLILKKKI